MKHLKHFQIYFFKEESNQKVQVQQLSYIGYSERQAKAFAKCQENIGHLQIEVIDDTIEHNTKIWERTIQHSKLNY